MSVSTDVINNNLHLKFDSDENTGSVWIQDTFGHRLTFSSSILSQQTLKYRVELICTHIKQHPAALRLIEKSLSQGSISLVFQLRATMRTEGHWHNSRRELALSDTLTDAHELLDAFIFELNNSINEKMRAVQLMDSENAEDYALKIETAEYETSQNTVPIMVDGVNKYGWPQPLGMTRPLLTLEEYLKHVRSNRSEFTGISHFNGYVIEYCNLKASCLEISISLQLEIIESANKELKTLQQDRYNSPGKTTCIQYFTQTQQTAQAKLDMAQKELEDLQQQKQHIESNAKAWKEGEVSFSNKCAWAQENVLKSNILVQKHREALDKIRALPQYAHDLDLQHKVYAYYNLYMYNLNADLRRSGGSYDNFLDSTDSLLETVKKQDKIIDEILKKHPINTRPKSLLTQFMNSKMIACTMVTLTGAMVLASLYKKS